MDVAIYKRRDHIVQFLVVLKLLQLLLHLRSLRKLQSLAVLPKYQSNSKRKPDCIVGGKIEVRERSRGGMGMVVGGTGTVHYR